MATINQLRRQVDEIKAMLAAIPNQFSISVRASGDPVPLSTADRVLRIIPHDGWDCAYQASNSDRASVPEPPTHQSERVLPGDTSTGSGALPQSDVTRTEPVHRPRTIGPRNKPFSPNLPQTW